jgi:uncharacterized protein YndB with AHSA1/START domain
MGTHLAQHGSFTIRRELDAPVALVFQAFADKTHKARWFKGPPDCKDEIREQDFRVGGADRFKANWASGMVTEFTARYFDIVPNARIVYVYEMMLDGRKISVSLATITFEASSKGTTLTVTEQGAFLDGYEDAGSREHGIGAQMDALAETLNG